MFEKFFKNSSKLHSYVNYLNPTIIEERKLNTASMDVFSRLMMDRIIFLGVPIDDEVANIVQAQLLYLASENDKEPIIHLVPIDKELKNDIMECNYYIYQELIAYQNEKINQKLLRCISPIKTNHLLLNK